jgi:VanZ family protein
MPENNSRVLHFRTYWLLLGWSMVVASFYLSLVPSPPKMITGLFSDKVLHALGYFILMLWFSQIYQSFWHRFWLVLGFVGMGVAIEYLQGMGGYRMFEYADMLADTVGVLLAWLVSTFGVGHVLHWTERKLFRVGEE